ncbi:hypothetical protein AS132_23690 [Photobacterium sanguinicancri]|nr:hypothetical protein AS132_23690 [Photobacterium sanguinicancri]
MEFVACNIMINYENGESFSSVANALTFLDKNQESKVFSSFIKVNRDNELSTLWFNSEDALLETLFNL